MKRRDFLGLATKGAVGMAALSAAGCAVPVAPAGQLQEAVNENPSLPTVDWQMATSWPVSLDTIFGGAQVFADRVAAMTNGKFTISPRAAGELAPGGPRNQVKSQAAQRELAIPNVEHGWRCIPCEWGSRPQPAQDGAGVVLGFNDNRTGRHFDRSVHVGA